MFKENIKTLLLQLYEVSININVYNYFFRKSELFDKKYEHLLGWKFTKK